MEVLLKWQQLLESENNWESVEVIITKFLDFHLKNKVKLQGRDINKFNG